MNIQRTIISKNHTDHLIRLDKFWHKSLPEIPHINKHGVNFQNIIYYGNSGHRMLVLSPRQLPRPTPKWRGFKPPMQHQNCNHAIIGIFMLKATRKLQTAHTTRNGKLHWHSYLILLLIAHGKYNTHVKFAKKRWHGVKEVSPATITSNGTT